MSEQFLLYEYDVNGYHSGGLPISEATFPIVFNTIIKIAKDEKRKVIITDMMDLCVFHMEDGEIIFPKPEDK